MREAGKWLEARAIWSGMQSGRCREKEMEKIGTSWSEKVSGHFSGLSP